MLINSQQLVPVLPDLRALTQKTGEVSLTASTPMLQALHPKQTAVVPAH